MKTRHFQDNAECRRHIRVTLTLDVTMIQIHITMSCLKRKTRKNKIIYSGFLIIKFTQNVDEPEAPAPTWQSPHLRFERYQCFDQFYNP